MAFTGPIFGTAHEQVEHLGRGYVRGRAGKDLFDPELAFAQLLFQLRSGGPDLIRTLQRDHLAIMRALRSGGGNQSNLLGGGWTAGPAQAGSRGC